MIKLARHRILWDSVSPASWLFGGGLLIMASDRLAHAIITLGALVWVYCLSSLAVHAGGRIFPRQGKVALLVFLASFIASVFLFLLWIISPFSALKMFFVISLVPVICLGSGFFERIETLSLGEKVFASISEALILGVLIMIFAFIREPLGFLSLSLPGGALGIILLFSFDTDAFLPIHVVASSSGALLLLGYSLGLYRFFKEGKQ